MLLLHSGYRHPFAVPLPSQLLHHAVNLRQQLSSSLVRLLTSSSCAASCQIQTALPVIQHARAHLPLRRAIIQHGTDASWISNQQQPRGSQQLPTLGKQQSLPTAVRLELEYGCMHAHLKRKQPWHRLPAVVLQLYIGPQDVSLTRTYKTADKARHSQTLPEIDVD